MNERQRLICAAAEEPGDDPRLVLSDWLEEHDEENRGTFIRTGVELARMDEADAAFPEVLARHLRSATFALDPKEPWFDFIPGANAWPIRGMLGGAVLAADEYLQGKAAAWSDVPLEELVLFGPKDAAAAKKLARRGELARLRLLGLSRWSVEAAWPLLCGCKHLAGLRELFLGSGPWMREDGPTREQFAEAVDLPGLETFSWREGDVLAWPTFVPALAGISRLILESGSDPELDDAADSWGWLVGTPLWGGLRQANVWHNINSISYSTIYQTDPMPDFGKNFAAAPLEDLRVAVSDLEHLAALKSWGALHTLRVGHAYLTEDLAPLASCKHARQLRRLFLDDPDGPEPRLGPAAPDVLCGKNLAGLRHLRYGTDYFAEGELAGLRGEAYREGLLRLELGEYGPSLNAEQLAELLAAPWPALRHLQIGLAGPEALAPLLTTPSLPSLCTLKIGNFLQLAEDDFASLARASGLPHLALVAVDVREWIIGGGAARPVAENVWLAERETIRSGPYK
jgi:uncharacterized protein (TIGR02996 family)